MLSLFKSDSTAIWALTVGAQLLMVVMCCMRVYQSWIANIVNVLIECQVLMVTVFLMACSIKADQTILHKSKASHIFTIVFICVSSFITFMLLLSLVWNVAFAIWSFVKKRNASKVSQKMKYQLDDGAQPTRKDEKSSDRTQLDSQSEMGSKANLDI